MGPTFDLHPADWESSCNLAAAFVVY